MRVGIMGAHDGHIGELIRSAQKSSNAELIGIVEPSDAVYERVTKRYGPLPRFHSLEHLIDEGKPELIIEGLNHKEKTELVVTAAAAGIHLILDKPLCHSLEDWRRMKEAVDAGGVKLSMWFSSRFYPPFVALQKHILAGDLGELVSFISTHPHKLSKNRPDWYFDPQVYTGVFHDLACHGVDNIRWLSGSEYTGVHAVASRVREHPGPLDDHVQASFTLASGAGALLTADWLTPEASPSFGDTRYIIMGTRGSAHLRAYADNHLLIVGDTVGVIEPSFDSVPTSPFVEEVIRSIEAGEEPTVSTQDVFAVAKACLAAQESVRLGGRFLTLDEI